MSFTQDGKLFPGGNQYNRFLKVLKGVLCGALIRDVLTEAGMTHGALGTHSARKGAATYVSSCSTSGPSAASICLRAGWTLPGVQDKYVRFKAAGDMVAGRYVAGLPFDSPDFAILPPFFNTQSGQIQDALELRQRIQVALDAIFPGVSPNLRQVCQFGLASLLYHKTFLQQNLPPTHLLFDTPLFDVNNELQLQWLQQRVECRKCQMDDYITATRIPSHVGLMTELASMRDTFAESFDSALKRHINGSVMSIEALEAAFASVLARSSLLQSAQHASGVEPTPRSANIVVL
ncbi:hypothetical protein PHMEG_00035653 [Phytophthora megakarya]|uniref:Uncharacterized protein n=1 Tax=Phytophthora megakarya TaxID=4795 RepID=A0A225UNJ0_9STRA|nr:hypothetical protein PHMEG_00035653 [Phytophthora megakarya]